MTSPAHRFNLRRSDADLTRSYLAWFTRAQDEHAKSKAKPQSRASVTLHQRDRDLAHQVADVLANELKTRAIPIPEPPSDAPWDD